MAENVGKNCDTVVGGSDLPGNGRRPAAAPPRPAITGIAQVAFYASDPAASKRFYADLLGWPRIQDKRISIAWAPGSKSKLRACLPVKASIVFRILLLPPQMLKLCGSTWRRTVLRCRRDFVAANGTRGFAMKDPEGHSIEFVEVKSTPPPATVHMEHSVSKRLIHAGFVVRNRALEDRFYKDLLGFHLYWYGGMKDTEADWIDMQVPDGTDWLEYMMVTGKGTLSPRTLGVLNHVALGVPKIGDVVTLLTRHGWRPSDDEQAQMGRDGKWQLNLYDPDGTRVEIMEFRPAEKPCCSAYTGEHPQ